MAYYTLQEHGALRVLPVPVGLRELTSDIAREVLRIQPSNILGFVADYTNAMLKARGSALAAAEAVGYMLEHDVTFGALLEKRGISLEDAQNACIVIQSAFRGFCTRRDLRESGALAMLDPVARKYGVSRAVAERAVGRIQAAFRGYLVRKILRHQMGSAEAWLADDFPRSKIIQYLLRSVGPDVANEAATKIQAVFRGFMVRKALEQSLYEEVRRDMWSKHGRTAGKSTAEIEKDYSIVDMGEVLDMVVKEGEEKVDVKDLKAFDEYGEMVPSAMLQVDETKREGEEGEQEEEGMLEEEEEEEEEEELEDYEKEKKPDVPGRPSKLDVETDKENESGISDEEHIVQEIIEEMI